VTQRDAVTVRLSGAPADRQAWHGELARLVAAAPPPAAALLEAASDWPHSQLTVRPPELVDLLGGSPAGATVRAEVHPGRAPHPPPALGSVHIATLVRTTECRERFSSERPMTVDRVGIDPALPRGTWLGVQTFWLPSQRGAVWLARRFCVAAATDRELSSRFRAVAIALAAEWRLAVEVPASVSMGRFGSGRDWRRGSVRTIPREAWFERPPEVAARSAEAVDRLGGPSSEIPVETPAIVLGASGSGKTTYLARWAANVVARGGSVFVLDLHGDLAPAITGRLAPDTWRRVVAIDASLPPVPGIAALVPDGAPDRAAAHLVAALKRLSPDGTDLYWGFRLERIFDTVVRLALESGGSLTDVYDLLTNPDRRDASRLATRSAELARFLDELAPVVRRNPEFLWSAATRLSKVMLVPALRELLAPDSEGVPVERLLADGRSLLVRLPFARLGPEAAGFAATLVLGRVYLGLAALAERRETAVPVSVVLDEVHAFSPRLVSELLTEGRKFGIRAVVATQYPERLSRELAAAARGALRGAVVFRVPRPAAVEVGGWLGLGAASAAELLPNLPTGEGLVVDPLAVGIRTVPPEARPTLPSSVGWRERTDATREEFDVPPAPFAEERGEDLATERLLLAVLSVSESGRAVGRAEAVAAAERLPGTSVDPALLAHRLPTLFREGYLEETPSGLRLTSAGERRLGLTTPTGATRESAEHRALLLATFRRLARRGYLLEILRQGRFDTTLPDARLRQLTGAGVARVPADLATELDRVRSGWAWTFFHGRDVHVEAEVSGALRAERIRHGVRKALRQGAFVLFVVSDAARARRVRAVLRAMGLGVDRAQVWTLRVSVGPGSSAPGTNR